jgi:hypothetical protein
VRFVSRIRAAMYGLPGPAETRWRECVAQEGSRAANLTLGRGQVGAEPSACQAALTALLETARTVADGGRQTIASLSDSTGTPTWRLAHASA